MIITLLTTGSRGDTQPYIALGLALQKSGYKVRLAASQMFEDLVTGFGLEFYSLPGNVLEIAHNNGLISATEADNPFKLLLGFNILKKYAGKYASQLQEGFYNACQGSDAIVYHPGAAIGHFIAQSSEIPSILATPFPMTPTREYPALVFYNSVRLGKTFNLLTHLLFERVMWQTSKVTIEQFWQRKFNCIPPNFVNPFSFHKSQNHLTLVSCSNYVFPRPSDWSKQIYNTGYWFLEQQNDWLPSPKLKQFLQAGKPPVYVGFGSLGNPKKAIETTKLAIDAINRSGQRAILATGWGGMIELEEISDNIFILKNVPHSWLFPQMSAIVHHGGAGTTAAALKAGIPSIIIPHANDQFAWGKRVYELGISPEPITRKQLTAKKLSIAIDRALQEDIKSEARIFGNKIQLENGVEKAAELITNFLQHQ